MTVPPLADDTPDWDAIARFRAGESVGDEARRVAAWLDANPADAELLGALDALVAPRLGADARPAVEPDVEAALRAVRARMGDERAPRVLAPRAKRGLAIPIP